jgi:putative secretion ATPase (PEP-CTERM system associated)
LYESFFNFHRKPFDLLPNPSFLYPSKSHKKVLAYLDYGIRERSGFILLTGEVGTGKTTIIRELIKKHLNNVLLARIFHTKVESLQLLAMVNEELGLDTTDKDKPTLLRELHEFLIEQYAKRRPVVLIIDEAQNLKRDVLEEVRMLSNLETEDDKLLHIILVGQPELRRVLATPELLQLRQRIQINCNIDPISEAEISGYILHRLEAAGNRSALAFSPECFPIISSYTKGIPRLINILCDYILLDAFANESREVSGDAIHEIAKDLSFQAQYWDSTPTEQPAPRSVGKGNALDRFRHTNTKLQDMLVQLHRRLQKLESFASKQDHTGNDDIKATLDAMNSRMEDLWRVMEQLKVKEDSPQALEEPPRVAPKVEPPALAETAPPEMIKPMEEESLPQSRQAKPDQQPWLKRILFGGS